MTALLYFWNRMSKYVKAVATHFQFQTKMRTPHNSQVQKSNRMKYHYHTKWVSCQLAIIRLETNMTLKISLVSPVSTISPRLTFLQYHLSTEKHNKIAHTVSPNHMGHI